MSTSNATNGHSDAPENGSKEEKTTSTRSKRKSAELVKAKASDGGEVIVLEDNTRLVMSEYLPNHRPLTASTMEVVGTLNSAGTRPIMADTIQIADLDTLPGHRPIAVSTLPVADLHVLPGDRPIAPNDVVDPPPAELMGYLD